MAGFSVTASHNPSEFSGVKIFNSKGMELPASDEEKVERALAVDVMKPSGVFGQLVSDEEAVDEYVQALVSRYEKAREPLRIAVDCASGPGGIVTPQVLKLLGHHVIPINAQVSWRFPARPPEPTASNLIDLSKMVPALGVDLAFAHDGDADRLVMLDALGRVVPDSILTILALRGVNASSGVVVISDNTSTAVAEEAERLGLQVTRSRVGKTFASLEAEGGVFAAEPSKVVDPRWGLWEDGINTAAMILSVVSSDRGAVGRVMEEVRWRYKQVNFDVVVKMRILMEKAGETFRKFKIQEERMLDGFKLVFADGSWVMFRSSGTEPKTRLYCESKDLQQLDVLVQLGTQCIESSK
jgi:phosphomannomutase